jgi:NAD(P)-dependent dehydrogenase (short-subunit alcohol dehydrogenase family)
MAIVLITGANAGIGRAAAGLLAAGNRVLLGCRDVARGEAAAAGIRAQHRDADVEVRALDLSSRRSIVDAAAAIDDVDVVVHNAAYFDISAPTRTLSVDGVETTWATNVLGPALLTHLLLPALLRSRDARVIAVTSKGLVLHPRLAVDFSDVEFSRRAFSVPRAYYQSKLAHLTWMLHTARVLRDTTVRVHGVRVTNVKIDISRYPNVHWLLKAMYRVKSRFAVSPEHMAKTYAWLAEGEGPGRHSGGYYDDVERPAPLSLWATVPEHQAKLSALVAQQLGISVETQGS